MQCNECGRQLTKLPFILDDSEIADMQLAIDKINTAQTALKAEVYASYRFEQDRDIYPGGELLVINGECFAHEAS